MSVIGDVASIGGNVFGAYSSYQNEKKRRRDAANARDEMAGYLSTYDTDFNNLNEAQRREAEQLAQSLKSNLSAADWDTAGQVDFNKDDYNVEDYYDPRRAQLVASAGRSAQSSAAMSGMGRSLGAAQGVASAMADTDANLYKDALSQMNTDRNFDYTVAKDTATQRLEALKNKIASQESIYNIDKGIADDYYGNEATRLATALQGNISKASTF